MRKIAGITLRLILFTQLSYLLCAILLLVVTALFDGLSLLMGRDRTMVGNIDFEAMLMTLVVSMLIIGGLFSRFESRSEKEKRKKIPGLE